MPRLVRLIAPDYPHHIIQRRNNRQNVFLENKDREMYLYLLNKYASENSCKLHSYCLMNNHIHLLSVPSHETSLAKTMQKTSLTYTQFYNKKYNRTGRLWECRFHSTIVDTDNYLLTVCRYIERNPVRAKIIDNPTDYLWSSAKTNGMGEKSNLVEPIWNNFIEKDAYLLFLNSKESDDDIKKIRKSTFTGKPLANEKFIELLKNKLGLTINIRKKGRPRKEI